MKVLILAAGYGTRMYSLVKDTPKALLEINNKPLLNYIFDRIGGIKGLNEVVLVTNDKFYNAFDQWSKQQRSFRHPITIINDETKTNEDRLGSIGDIDFVLKHTTIEEDLLVIGSDNLFDYNIDDYVRFARERSPSVTVGLYDIRDRNEATKFGVVELGEGGKITSFAEKPKIPQSSLIAMCFYYLPQDSLGLIGDYLLELNKPDKAGDYISWLCRKHDVYGFQFAGTWYDIGSVEAYKEAQEKFRSFKHQ
jgi:glucose-1-phosphate thymidylyltransferase